MKQSELSKTTWHWRLASVYGPLSEFRSETNICEYTRAVLGGLFIAFCAAFIPGAALGFTIGNFAGWIGEMLILGHFTFPDQFAAIFPVLLMGTIVCAGFALLKSKYEDYKYEKMKQEPEPPGFVKQAYQSFKSKTCWKITLT